MSSQLFWKEQEKFSNHILNLVLDLLIKDNFTVKTSISNYRLVYKCWKGTADGGSQLTDKIITLQFKNSAEKIVITYLYIESKAYFSEKTSSISSIEKSFKKFFSDLWSDIWYASMYCIFKGGETYWVYDFLDKLISDVTNCPDSYFEITKEIFENEKYENPLENLFTITSRMKEDSEKLIEFDKFFKENPLVIEKLKTHLWKNIEQTFSIYETSEKRLDILLQEKLSHTKDKSNILTVDNCSNGFKFECKEVIWDLEKAKEEQWIYLLNKYHYFNNPLISKNIEEIEEKLVNDCFKELHGNEFKSMKYCADSYLSEFWGISFPKEWNRKIKDYLFDSKTQKRWFLFDSWAKKKCLFHYKKENQIFFLNNSNNG